MGKKAKQQSNKKLATPHPEGSKIALLQTCVHEMGQIAILHPNYWSIHYNLAKKNLKKISKLQKEILYLNPDKANFRLLSDPKLIFNFYNQGTQLIINTYLSFEHLTSSILDRLFNTFKDPNIKKHEGDDLSQKLNYVLTYMNFEHIKSDSGYSYLFSEIERTRHNINHPRRFTTHNSGEFTWDNVPLAWLVAEKYKNINQTFALLETFYQDSETYFKNNSQENISITVERGIQSLNHIKIVKRK